MTKLLAAFVPIFALLVCTCFAARATDTAAIKWCRELEQSDEAAQAGFAYYYHQGEHVSPDDAAAIKWCRKDAEQGNWAAQFYLALIYYHGEGVPRDYAEAMKWWRKAAAQGNAWAQTSLAQLSIPDAVKHCVDVVHNLPDADSFYKDFDTYYNPATRRVENNAFLNGHAPAEYQFHKCMSAQGFGLGSGKSAN